MAITHLARRLIEAKLIGRFYHQLRTSLDGEQALELIGQTLQRAAGEEGAAFASQAEPGPSLGHFASILDDWDEALEVEPVERSATALRFNVVRCKYVEAYRDLGLPAELVRLLSCSRDAPFAGGYSDRLVFSRSGTLADGAPCCDFCYRWSDATEQP
ncbi:MAG: L-2-amino-thiazoline-4-carboxylic acid hydrolase [Deltaproteobacteria bacterium]|nr:L-2-amino-thiazoline-4-carboxylic acid hydrolase [Deltaproteobacteria bacterium]